MANGYSLDKRPGRMYTSSMGEISTLGSVGREGETILQRPL
jgi:hypothetical protein